MIRVSSLWIILIAQFFYSSASAQDAQKLELYLETGHTGPLWTAVFSPDAKTISSIGGDNTMKLWDVKSGLELNTANLGQVAFSADQTTIASWEFNSKVIALFDVASWRQLPTLSSERGVHGVVFAPTGKTIATWNDSSLGLWDVKTGKRLAVLDRVSSPNSLVIFSPNGKILAWGNRKNRLTLWNIEFGQELHSLEVSPDVVFAAFSSDETAFACWTDRTLSLWNVSSGRKLYELDRPARIEIVAFSPNGQTLVVGSGSWNDLTIALFDAATGKQRHILKEHNRSFSQAFFLADGKTVVVGGWLADPLKWPQPISLAGASLWDVASGKELVLLKGITQLALSPDRSALAVWVVDDKTVNLWDAASWRESHVLTDGIAVKSVTFSPDGKVIGLWHEQAITLWDTKSGRRLNSISRPYGFFANAVFSSDGKTVATLNGDQTITVADAVSGKELHTLKGSVFPARLFALSPNGKRIATWVWGTRVIKLWDLQSASAPRTLSFDKDPVAQQHHSVKANAPMLISPWLSVVFSPSGKTIAEWVSSDKSVTLWDTETGKRLHILDEHTKPVVSVAFSQDGETIATSSEDYSIKLWDVASGRTLQTLLGHVLFAFSPDSRTIATGLRDGSVVKLWDVVSGKEVLNLRGQPDPQGTSPRFDLVVAFSRDSRTIATVSGDGAVKLWDVASGRELGALISPAGQITSIGFSVDGNTIVTGGIDKTVSIWEAASGRLLKTLQTDNPKTFKEVYSVAPDYYRLRVGDPILTSRGQVSPDGRFLVSMGDNGRVNFFDIESDSLLMNLVSLADDEWAVTNAEGRFDTNKSLDQIQGVHWVVNNEITNPLMLDVFMRQYYEPRLLHRLLNKEQFKPLPSIADINRVQPRVDIKEVKPVPSGIGSVDVTVTVKSSTEDVSVSAADITKRKPFSSGVFDLRLFRNGQLVGHTTTDENLQSTFKSYKNFDDELTAWREANKVDLVDGKKTITFTVTLPANSNAKEVEFSAYAFNEDRVKSETARQLWSLDEAAKTLSGPRTKPRAYVIAVGVNANENPSFDLQFAANDARRFQEVLPQRLVATGEYSEVVPVSLISDWEMRRGQKVTTKTDATKANFKVVLDLLAGRPVADEIKRAIPNAEKLARTTPDDMVLILFSSHGYADQSGNFYFIPYDTGPDACSVFTETVRQRSISSDELSLWLRDVDAGQMTLIVDACYSTAAIEGSGFKPGPMGSRGLGQLAYDKRMRILTATQADNIAMELPATADGRPVNHGLLSYALLEDGLGGNKADFKPHDKTIFMDEWLEYAVAEVPKLFANQPRPINETKPNSRQRNDRPRLVLLKRELADPGVCRPGPSAGPSRIQEQQPSLFDFTRRKREVALVRNP